MNPSWPSKAPTSGGKIIRVACVGDSITQGAGTARQMFDAYPAQLQRMLDAHWLIGNFGNSGSTLLKNGDKPYQKQGSLRDALGSQPDIVIIMLGTNDSKPQNWILKDQFVADYQDLIGKFRALPSHPRLFICHPPHVAGIGNYGISEPVVGEEIPLIDQIAKTEKVEVIDMHAPLLGHDDLLSDRVHPNTAGANLLARTVFQKLTGKEFTGELAAELHSEWQGYPRVDFVTAGRSCLLVSPKTAAPGNPWIWRMEFFGVEPQADLALLARGYHVAYMNLENMYGAPVALDLMDRFDEQLVQQKALAPRVVLEGFSRGGLFAFNWAARHPDRVASIYADAPVCDFKSWPAGKGQGLASLADWQRLLQCYGFTEEQALAYPGNPVDNLQPLAGAKIPILIVCGDADKTVPYEENAALVESRYRAFGGEIKVIVKPGGDHHPHSLKDPAPIVDFILAHPAHPAVGGN